MRQALGGNLFLIFRHYFQSSIVMCSTLTHAQGYSYTWRGWRLASFSGGADGLLPGRCIVIFGVFEASIRN